jgi:hypothetical protein
VLASPMLAGANDLLAAAAIEAGLPAICQWFESAEAGCFSSYGPTLAEVFRTAGSQLALVLVGPAIVSLRIAHQDACANQLEEDVYKPPLAWKPVVTFPPEVGSLEISALGAWDHSEPTYEEIVAKVQRAIDDWKKTKQALETQEAGRLLGLAAQVQDVGPGTASDLRKMAGQLRDDGIDSFGACQGLGTPVSGND